MFSDSSNSADTHTPIPWQSNFQKVGAHALTQILTMSVSFAVWFGVSSRLQSVVYARATFTAMIAPPIIRRDIMINTSGAYSWLAIGAIPGQCLQSCTKAHSVGASRDVVENDQQAERKPPLDEADLISWQRSLGFGGNLAVKHDRTMSPTLSRPVARRPSPYSRLLLCPMREEPLHRAFREQAASRLGTARSHRSFGC